MDKNLARLQTWQFKFGIDSEFKQHPGDYPSKLMLKKFFCFIRVDLEDRCRWADGSVQQKIHL
ncbi:hypothetical protein [Desulfosporosinus nitroreducens]|uniref:Uncharacterized protein n=1 Tax=Desulfosporosinus nitroreducens TaxID=2018668 RepID=A0ABT8QQ49_9FIRM|nr:hypothetical protein [Desulfosporosinus nitroreducens]MDO0823483.1 hypothetical protein [Desulfosporosinus nitroreducens]